MRIFCTLLLLTLNSNAQALLLGNGVLSGNAALAFTAQAVGGGGGGAPGFDTYSTNSATGAATVSWPHTNGSGANRILIVGLGAGFAGLPTVSSVTLSGIPMTNIANSATYNGNWDSSTLYYICAPASGSNLISATFSTPPNNFIGAAFGLTNAHQTAPIANVATNTSTANLNATVTISSATDQLVLSLLMSDANTSIAPGGGAFSPGEVEGLAGDNSGGMSSTNGAATIIMSWTGVGADNGWAISAVGIKPP